VAGQLATTRQIIKDLVGVDISDIITGRATGAAAGEGVANAESEPKPRRRAAVPAAKPAE
jgi:flotillin